MSGVVGNFGTFVAEEKVNPYTETLAEFAKISDKNPDASWTIEIDAAKETVERVRIAEAANAVGKTARLRARDDSKRKQIGSKEKSGNPVYDGRVTLTFTLSEKHKPRRGKNAENVQAEETQSK